MKKNTIQLKKMMHRGRTYSLVPNRHKPNEFSVYSLNECNRCDVTGAIVVYLKDGDYYHKDCDFQLGSPPS